MISVKKKGIERIGAFALSAALLLSMSFTCTDTVQAAGSGTSAEAANVLEQVASGKLDGKTIETVNLENYLREPTGAPVDLNRAVANAIGGKADGDRRVSSNKIVRLVVPEGRYFLSSAIYLYSNVILDCRGDGANTPKDSTDDSKGVEIYTNYDNGCLVRAGKKGEESKGYDFYKNITILGGTYHGTNPNGGGVVGSNVRFGHTSNIKCIGLNIKDNCGAHHMEVGASDGILVADCQFSGYTQGDTSASAKEYSIEALQLDVTHRSNLNFADYDTNDDLAAKNATIKNCNFNNVFRGVGSHHAVLGSYYTNIKILDNSFTDLDDRAINASYFKGGEIKGNVVNDAVSGIFISSMVPEQYYQPNAASAKKTSVEKLNSNLLVSDNKITLSGSKSMSKFFSENLIKYGIKVGGENVTGADASAAADEDAKAKGTSVKNPVPTGKYYLTGVKIQNNSVNVTGSVTDSTRIKTGMLLWYLRDCKNIQNNTIDLAGKNATDATAAGIKVNYSMGNTLSKNSVSGVSAGSNACGIQVSDGSTSTTLTGNTINKAAKDGISVTRINDSKTSIVSNKVNDSKKNGITVFKSKINNINKNTIKNSAGKGIFVSSTIKLISGNTINNSKGGQGISVEGTVTTIKGNTINKAKQHGIYVYKGKASTLFEKNTVKGAKNIAIYTDNGVKYAIGNKLSGNKKNTVGMKKGVAFKVKTLKVKPKKSVKMASKVFKSSGKITWSVNKKKIAKINKNGVLKALKKGVVTVTAKKNGIKTTCKVTIK